MSNRIDAPRTLHQILEQTPKDSPTRDYMIKIAEGRVRRALEDITVARFTLDVLPEDYRPTFKLPDIEEDLRDALRQIERAK